MWNMSEGVKRQRRNVVDDDDRPNGAVDRLAERAPVQEPLLWVRLPLGRVHQVPDQD